MPQQVGVGFVSRHGILPLALAFLTTAPALAAPKGDSGSRSRPAVRIPIGVELGGEAWDTNRLQRNPRIREELERLGHEEEEWDALQSLPPGEVGPPYVVQALGTDVCVNDRSLSTCTCSAGRRISQAESSVAAWGPYVVVSWNDRRGVCLGGDQPSQSYAWSSDYGATFHEGALLRGPGANDFFHGDPTVAVNRNTGVFYISGILRQTNTFVGIVALRGHFVADTFAIDTRRVIALAQDFDFLDKPWMAVDPASGHVYVTWTNFHGDYTGAIELQRLDANLDPLGPVVVVMHSPYGAEGPQGSFPTVGPNGELYVPYGIFYADTTSALWSTPSRFEVRRSDDDGLTFGPPATIASVQYHPQVIVTGNQRGFWADLFAMDVDRSNGPHRGRSYVVWSEHRPIGGAQFGSNSVFEQESNDFFARATAFTPGDLIRASSSISEKDRFRFTGHRGEVFWCTTDSSTLALRARLLCFADTASLATYRLFYSRASNAAGDFQFAVGLPYDGTYYLEVDNQSGQTGTYLIRTALVPASPSDRSRDIRDIYVSWSDGGSTWSPPIRLNDDDPWFDASDPQVAVDGKGRVHTFWFDWRDDPECGTSSNQYGRSSGDGGVTWGANRRLTDASSFWGNLASCSDNNQGDFTQMTASEDHVYSAFTDSRLGDPDIFLDASTYRSLAQCPASRLVQSGADNPVDFSLANGGNFATPLAWSCADSRGWLTGAIPSTSGSQTLTANGGSVTVSGTFHPPSGCTGVDDTVRFVTWDPNIPGAYDTCTTVLTCSPSVSVPVSRTPALSLALDVTSGNPSTGPLALSFTLPSNEPAHLLVLDLAGRRIASRDLASFGIGAHEITFPETRALSAGVYLARLGQGGREVSRSFVLIR